ncbi:DNA polymerase-3 subunit delta' [Catalinimonas alkaloidigena]|uniref:DNA polymerase III subunit n=1 Tax=Catalinimonas alkaloidigena TaxID=1075417 RepID=UPI002405BEC7|nr:DNA polymerase III subunit delta [Catalinimonas alkaloidigena]MDF9796223.1 DNA polymerase-3 subunit delta' [Catalinimonas alkaloidigena]
MQFSDISGLEEIKQSLINTAREGHVAHAQLFLGPEGSANLAMAVAFATYLNSYAPAGEESSGKVFQEEGTEHAGLSDKKELDKSSLEKLNKFIHPDVHFVFPVSATKNISGKDVVSDSYIKEWRSFLAENPYGDTVDWSAYFGAENKQLNISKEESRNIIRKLSLKSFEGKYKIVILWLPELLHPSAANGILKILEEPPDNTLFFLVANDVEKILPTILSRTQIVNIRAFTNDEIVYDLAKRERIADPQDKRMLQLRQIATLADGNLNQALRLSEEVEEDSHKFFRDWMRTCYVQDYSKLIQMMDQVQKMGKEAQKGLMQYGLSMLRETLMVLAADNTAEGNDDVMLNDKILIRVQGDELKFIANFSKVMSFDKVESITKLLNQGYYHLMRNANPKIVFLDISLKIGQVLR